MYDKFFDRANRFYENSVKKRNYYLYRDFLEESQWWSPDRLREFQWAQLRELLDKAASDVPYWRRFFKRNGAAPRDISGYEDFRKLPVTDKSVIRPAKEDFISDKMRGKTWPNSTGGSTGEPLHFEYTPESYDWRMAVSKRGYSWAGCSDGRKVAYVWGVPSKKAGLRERIKKKAHHAAFRKRVYNCFDFTEEKMRSALKEMNGWKPAGIIGYVNSLYDFTRFVERSGGAAFRPEAVVGAAEKLHDYQRNLMEKVFGCPVFDTYGCREFMLVASECAQRRGLHVNTENLFLEVLREDGSPAAPGETGRLTVTDLHNHGMPFIRYQNGDLASLTEKGRCPCGRGLPLIEGIAGRSADMIRTPQGKMVSGIYFPRLLRGYREIRKFQVIQDSLSTLTVKLVLDEDLPEKELAFLGNDIRSTVGDGVSVNIEKVENIPLTKTGKHRITVSRIAS